MTGLILWKCSASERWHYNIIIIFHWPAANTKWSLIWGLWHQKQTSQAGISNCILHNTVECNYSSLPEISASCTKVLLCDLGCFLWVKSMIYDLYINKLLYMILHNIQACYNLKIIWKFHGKVHGGFLALNHIISSLWSSCVRVPNAYVTDNTDIYRKVSNIRHTKSQNLNASRLIL